jgi:nitrite reductase (NADH) large subunit
MTRFVAHNSRIMKKYLVIGNGVAGTTAAENIRQNDAKGEITIVTDEDLPFYYRVRLPELLAGKVTESELIAKKKDWYHENKILLKLQTKITAADPAKKKVHIVTGESFVYDRLLLANGSKPFIPPIKGADLQGVFTLHNINDVRRISDEAGRTDKVILIGGGLLGLEAAYALHKIGKKITVVEFFPRLLPRQLDNEGAKRLQSYFERLGFSFRLGAKTREIQGSKCAESVVLEDGAVLPAEMIILSAGVRPRLNLARMLDLHIDKGVIVNRYMQTSNPDIFAAGDVVEYDGRTYGIWPAAMEQGKIAGTNMSGGNLAYTGTVLSTILKVAGIDLASAGEIDENNHYPVKIVATNDIYKKVVMNDNRVIGCIMLGNMKNFRRINKAIASGENILAELDFLLAS